MPAPSTSTNTAVLPLKALAEHDDIEPIDVETARLMRRLGSGRSRAALERAALLLSARRRAGASCVRLEEWAGRPFPEEGGFPRPGHPGESALGRLPALADWRARLEASPLVGDERTLAEEEATPTPLVLADDGRLYLYRWWRAEQEVARLLRQRLEGEAEPPPAEARDAFGRFFEVKADDAPVAGQAVAAVAALYSPLTVVTGGPGTGKTYAAARLLALLLTARPDMNVALAAPTGKAAKRLGSSIAREVETLRGLSEAVRQAVPSSAQTLHRLLGYRPRENRFRFHAGRPLDVDALLVDESSMIDLLMFRALLEALPARTRLVFLGDQHQLASIGAGRVLADLATLQGTGRSPSFARYCRQLGAGRVPIAAKGPPLRDAVVALQKNYRFGQTSGIAALAAAVRAGAADRAVEVLKNDAYPEVRWVAHPDEPSAVLGGTLQHARTLCRAGHPEASLARKAQAQVLAATYHGPWGVRAVNDFVERALLREGHRTSGQFYLGRLVLVTANDYEQELFNGDLGVCAADDGRLRVYFDGAGDAPRAVAPARLPRHESAWAVTVHKSQGSEYDTVTLLLPEEMRPPLCRELIYTAVTRAKERVTLVGPEAVLRQSIAAPERRASGLPEALRGS